MEPIKALNTLSQVTKQARLPYNDHVILERSIEVLSQAINSSTKDAEIIPEAEVLIEPPVKKTKSKSKSKKG